MRRTLVVALDLLSSTIDIAILSAFFFLFGFVPWLLSWLAELLSGRWDFMTFVFGLYIWAKIYVGIYSLFVVAASADKHNRSGLSDPQKTLVIGLFFGIAVSSFYWMQSTERDLFAGFAAMVLLTITNAFISMIWPLWIVLASAHQVPLP